MENVRGLIKENGRLVQPLAERAEPPNFPRRGPEDQGRAVDSGFRTGLDLLYPQLFAHCLDQGFIRFFYGGPSKLRVSRCTEIVNLVRGVTGCLDRLLTSNERQRLDQIFNTPILLAVNEVGPILKSNFPGFVCNSFGEFVRSLESSQQVGEEDAPSLIPTGKSLSLQLRSLGQVASSSAENATQ
jgi:hypothetical protein